MKIKDNELVNKTRKRRWSTCPSVKIQISTIEVNGIASRMGLEHQIVLTNIFHMAILNRITLFLERQ